MAVVVRPSYVLSARFDCGSLCQPNMNHSDGTVHIILYIYKHEAYKYTAQLTKHLFLYGCVAFDTKFSYICVYMCLCSAHHMCVYLIYAYTHRWLWTFYTISTTILTKNICSIIFFFHFDILGYLYDIYIYLFTATMAVF